MAPPLAPGARPTRPVPPAESPRGGYARGSTGAPLEERGDDDGNREQGERDERDEGRDHWDGGAGCGRGPGYLRVVRQVGHKRDGRAARAAGARPGVPEGGADLAGPGSQQLQAGGAGGWEVTSMRITYSGGSNGGMVVLGGDPCEGGGEALEFPRGEYTRSSLALAEAVLGGPLPGFVNQSRAFRPVFFASDGEISDAQAETLRRVFHAANEAYAARGDRAAGWQAGMAELQRRVER